MDKKNAVLISSSETFAKGRAIFLSVHKMVNIQGYISELREPIKTRKNCYPQHIYIYFAQIHTTDIY